MNCKVAVCGCLCSAVILLASFVMVSCSKSSGDLYDSVPASVSMVADVDLSVVLQQAGCSIGPDGEVTLTSGLDAVMRQPGSIMSSVPVRTLIALGSVVDLTHVVVFNECNSGRAADNVFVVTVTDPERFREKIQALSGGQCEVSGSVELFSVDSWTLAVNENRVWMAAMPSAEMAQAVSGFLALKHDDGIGAVSGVADFLGGSRTVRVALRPDAIAPITINGGDVVADRWSCLSVDIDNTVISTEFFMIDSHGHLSLCEGMRDVDAGFLAHVPQSFVLAGAMDVSPDFKWGDLLATASLLVGRNEAQLSVVKEVAPLLAGIDGTVAFAAGPAAGAPAVANIGPDTWDALLMIQMPADEIDRTLDMIRAYSSLGGLKITDKDDGTMSLKMSGGVDLHVGNLGGALAVSNREFETSAVGNEAMADVFQSSQAAVTLNVAAGSEIVKAFGWPCGFDFSMWMADDCVHGRFSLNGTDVRVLQMLVDEFVVSE